MIKAVFFDAAHTLIDPHPPSAQVYAEFGRRHGHTVTADSLARALQPLWWRWREEKARDNGAGGTDEAREREWWRRLVDQAYREGGDPGGVSEECFDEIYEHFSQGEAWSVFPDVFPTLMEMRARRMHLGVLSNFDRRLRRVLREHDLFDLFDSVTISSEVGREKPHPDIYRHALQAASTPADQALMVGDDWEHDVEGPTKQGMQAFWIRRKGDAGGRPHIRSLEEMLLVLDGQDSGGPSPSRPPSN